MKTPTKGFCVHFRGIQHRTCRAGVDWRSVTGGPELGIALRMPCNPASGTGPGCEHCRYPTPEEQAQQEAEIDALIARGLEDNKVIAAAHRMDGGVSQVYVCERCDRAARFTTQSRAELLVHFVSAHVMQTADWTDATQEHLCHSDARDWFQDDYRLSVQSGPLCLYSVRMARRKGNGRW